MKRLSKVLRFASTEKYLDWRTNVKAVESGLVPPDPPPRKKSKRSRRAGKHK